MLGAAGSKFLDYAGGALLSVAARRRMGPERLGSLKVASCSDSQLGSSSLEVFAFKMSGFGTPTGNSQSRSIHQLEE